MKNSTLKHSPVLSKPAVPSAKMLTPDKTPARLRDLMDIAREAGQKSAEGSWNMMCQLIHDKMAQIPGTDALSIMTTCLTYFNATWIVLLKHMADSDEAGIETDEIIKAMIEGAQKVVKTAKMKR